MGSSVVSGTALGVVIKTGLATEFGEISKRLASINQPTTFDRGINKFVWLMIRGHGGAWSLLYVPSISLPKIISWRRFCFPWRWPSA